MKKEQFDHLVEEIIGKIGDGPDSHYEALSLFLKKHQGAEELKVIVSKLNDSLVAIRIIIKYLLFDLEATRRERDQLRMMLEDKDD